MLYYFKYLWHRPITLTYHSDITSYENIEYIRILDSTPKGFIENI